MPAPTTISAADEAREESQGDQLAALQRVIALSVQLDGEIDRLCNMMAQHGDIDALSEVECAYQAHDSMTHAFLTSAREKLGGR